MPVRGRNLSLPKHDRSLLAHVKISFIGAFSTAPREGIYFREILDDASYNATKGRGETCFGWVRHARCPLMPAGSSPGDSRRNVSASPWRRRSEAQMRKAADARNCKERRMMRTTAALIAIAAMLLLSGCGSGSRENMASMEFDTERTSQQVRLGTIARVESATTVLASDQHVFRFDGGRRAPSPNAKAWSAA